MVCLTYQYRCTDRHWHNTYRTAVPTYQYTVQWGIPTNWYIPPTPIPCRTGIYHLYRAVRWGTANLVFCKYRCPDILFNIHAYFMLKANYKIYIFFSRRHGMKIAGIMTIRFSKPWILQPHAIQSVWLISFLLLVSMFNQSEHIWSLCFNFSYMISFLFLPKLQRIFLDSMTQKIKLKYHYSLDSEVQSMKSPFYFSIAS